MEDSNGLACNLVITIPPLEKNILPAIRSADAIRPLKLIIIDQGLCNTKSNAWWEDSETESGKLLKTYEKHACYPTEQWEDGVPYLHIPPNCHVSPQAAKALLTKYSAYDTGNGAVAYLARIRFMPKRGAFSFFEWFFSLMILFNFMGNWWKIMLMGWKLHGVELEKKTVRILQKTQISNPIRYDTHNDVHIRIEDPTSYFNEKKINYTVIGAIIAWFYYGVFLTLPIVPFLRKSTDSTTLLLVYLFNVLHIHSLTRTYFDCFGPLQIIFVSLFHPLMSWIYMIIVLARWTSAYNAVKKLIWNRECTTDGFAFCVTLAVLIYPFFNNKELPSLISVCTSYPFIIIGCYVFVSFIVRTIEAIFRRLFFSR